MANQNQGERNPQQRGGTEGGGPDFVTTDPPEGGTPSTASPRGGATPEHPTKKPMRRNEHLNRENFEK